MITLRPIDLSDSAERQMALSHRLDTTQFNFGSHDRFWNDFPNEQGYFDWLAKKQAIDPLFVSFAMLDATIVGQVEMGLAKEPKNWGYINLIYVVPGQRGAGIGAQVVSAAERHFAARGLPAVRLTSHAPITANTKFYEKCGWSCLGERPGHPESLLWEKKLA